MGNVLVEKYRTFGPLKKIVMPYVKPLPSSGFYAVIFCSTKSEMQEGYAEMDEQTMRLAAEQPGYLGYESAGSPAQGIFISYWETKAAIEQWKEHAVHRMAKEQAQKWYTRYLSQVCFVESSRLYQI